MSLLDGVLEQLRNELVNDFLKVYIVMFPQECGYCEPGIEKIFLNKFDADRFCSALNIAEKIKDSQFQYFVKEFEVEL